MHKCCAALCSNFKDFRDIWYILIYALYLLSAYFRCIGETYRRFHHLVLVNLVFLFKHFRCSMGVWELRKPQRKWTKLTEKNSEYIALILSTSFIFQFWLRRTQTQCSLLTDYSNAGSELCYYFYYVRWAEQSSTIPVQLVQFSHAFSFLSFVGVCWQWFCCKIVHDRITIAPVIAKSRNRMAHFATYSECLPQQHAVRMALHTVALWMNNTVLKWCIAHHKFNSISLQL